MTVEHRLYTRKRDRVRSPTRLRDLPGIHAYGAAVLVIAGLTGGFFIGRGTAPRYPTAGVTVETWDDDGGRRGIGFRVVDSYALEETTLIEGEIYCDAEAKVDLAGPPITPITQAQLAVFQAGAAKVCIGEVPNLYQSQLTITLALGESGILGAVVDARHLQLGK